jgi:hypothetical protein
MAPYKVFHMLAMSLVAERGAFEVSFANTLRRCGSFRTSLFSRRGISVSAIVALSSSARALGLAKPLGHLDEERMGLSPPTTLRLLGPGGPAVCASSSLEDVGGLRRVL